MAEVLETAIPPPAKKLSNMQQLLLRLYARNIPEDDLLVIKGFLERYFGEKLMDEADKVWDKRGYSNELMKEWVSSKRSELKK
ncbi:MAG: hypothetical protein ACKVUS_12720 [Saprospiraceae bacterium]